MLQVTYSIYSHANYLTFLLCSTIASQLSSLLEMH